MAVKPPEGELIACWDMIFFSCINCAEAAVGDRLEPPAQHRGWHRGWGPNPVLGAKPSAGDPSPPQPRAETPAQPPEPRAGRAAGVSSRQCPRTAGILFLSETLWLKKGGKGYPRHPIQYPDAFPQ